MGYAAEGTRTVEDVSGSNRTQDAKTDFHGQLFSPEHKSYCSELGVQILNERRTTANVGYLKRARAQLASAEPRLSVRRAR